MSKSLKESLQSIIKKGYEEICYHLKVIPYRTVIFKGFFGSEVFKEIINNQEILDNLEIKTPRLKKYFAEELENLILRKAGMAFPAKFETWIIINPYYVKTDLDDNLVLDFVETVAHETAHAVIFNWDIGWGHVEPHGEITEILQDYYQKNYDWKKLLIESK